MSITAHAYQGDPSMARPKRDIYRTTLVLPQELQDKIDFWLRDPTHPEGRLYYGAFSRITEILWKQFIRNLEASPDPANFLRQFGVKIGEGEKEAATNGDEL